VWLCPLVSVGSDLGTKWPTYPLAPGRTYVNVGFWGAVPVGPDAPNGPKNRAIEERVHQLDGHKSLYSESFYDPETFSTLYDERNLTAVKMRYDPDCRFISLYEKAVSRR
jgi:FAD/FMN-containing dehydrogenase